MATRQNQLPWPRSAALQVPWQHLRTTQACLKTGSEAKWSLRLHAHLQLHWTQRPLLYGTGRIAGFLEMGEGRGGAQFRHSRLRISRINQEGWHVFEVCMFRPICQLVSRFANGAAQSAYYPGICLICKLCQPISFHNMKLSNVGRQQSKILTIVISVTIFHKRQLLLMLVSCHSLCRISTFNTRYFSGSH